MVTPPDDRTADLHAVNATLRAELDAALVERSKLAEALAERTTELAARSNEYRESIEHQSAATDVLKVMSSSPGDPQPVFDLMVRHANELCNGSGCGIFEFDGSLVHIRASYTRSSNLSAVDQYLALFPMVPTRGSFTCRAILDGQTVHITDTRADIAALPVVKALGYSSQLSIPLMRDGAAIGAISLGGALGGFSDSQIALLQTFAEQAVIAITSAETYRTLQGRTSDLQEALEQQTATTDVLRTINASPGELVPVSNAILEWAHRVCDADGGVLYTFDGTYVRVTAVHGFPSDHAAEMLAREPYLPPNAVVQKMIATRRFVQVEDAQAVYEGGKSTHPRDLVASGMRTAAAIPLLKDGHLLGYITAWRREARLFSEKQMALLENFADQAVIAMENARLLNETQEALEQQTATAEVLGVINSSPGELAPVFDAILEKALGLCEATHGHLTVYQDGHFHCPAAHGDPGFLEWLRRRPPYKPGPGTTMEKIAQGASVVQVADVTDDEAYRLGDPVRRAAAEIGGGRTAVSVALRKEDTLFGAVTVYRQEVRPFSDKQIALLQNFAAQAVIAMENARLLTEQQEALEQQTATAEVLQVINASPGDLAPVFDAMLDKAIRLCDATYGHFRTYDGEGFPLAAVCGDPNLVEFHRQVYAYFAPGPHNPISRFRRGEDLVHISDAAASEGYRADPGWRELVDIGALRSVLAVALRKDTVLLGYISVYRQEVRAFSDKQVALLQNFAAQAVIAMENARLMDEIRQRQEELRITFENMGDGVALFDEAPRLVAWNRHFQEMFNLPDDLLEQRNTYEEHLGFLAARGDFGSEQDAKAQLRTLLASTDKPSAYERTRPDGRVLEIRRNPVPSGGFVLIFSDITERKRSEAELRAARDAAEGASRTIEVAYRDLKAAQANLIQAEKMASLGQLTAGIAHEIKNPLNFVNNFAELSGDLLDELHDAVAGNQQAEIDELTATLKGNLAKIAEHGRRADGIVRSMLEHSRGSSGELRSVDLNALVDEAMNLAYHGARAQDQSFNIALQRDFDEGIRPITLVPQDITRVLLNLFSNGFYAARRRQSMEMSPGFEPTLKVATRELGDAVEIRVRDNGIGIPEEIKDKLFQPFFTTKPTGEGTGLGLSISYDIVSQQHGGSITVDSKVGEYSEFTIRAPRTA
jgi:PAS domain S-box-containing protein